MSKGTITRLFLGGIVAAIAGIVVAFLAVWGAYTAGVFEMNGPDVTGINMTPFAWLMSAFAIGGLLAIIGGGVAGLVSWIGALLNTAELNDKAWFLLVLLLGIFNFGLLGMLVYVLVGPDGTQPRPIALPSAA